MEMSKEEMKDLYGKLGQILDGVWFLELEKKFGFDVAYEIDEEVWKIFPRKEAKRIMRALKIEEPTIDDIAKILDYSIFNSSLDFTTENITDEGGHVKGLRFIVTKCKTFEGMKKVGRPDEQIYKICEGVGIAFFNSFLEPIVGNPKVECISCPHHPKNNSIEDENQVCTWEFLFNKI